VKDAAYSWSIQGKKESPTLESLLALHPIIPERRDSMIIYQCATGSWAHDPFWKNQVVSPPVARTRTSDKAPFFLFRLMVEWGMFGRDWLD